MSSMNLKRNTGFDFLKYICAFLIICIHTDYSTAEYIKPIARIAVPIFFMISGYFYASVCKAERQSRQIKKILFLTVFANQLYLLWALMLAFLSTGSVISTIRSWFDPRIWLRFLILNESPFRSHLWYLSALLYVLVIVYIFEKVKIHTNHCYPMIPVLLCINLVLGNYSLFIFGTNIDLEFSRNFLFMGFPCFLLGDFLYCNERFGRISNAHLWLIFVISVLLTQFERILLIQCSAFENCDFFMGTIFSAFSVFLLVKNNPSWFRNRAANAIAWLGRELSLGLYIFNVIVRTFVLEGIEIAGKRIPVIEEICYHTMPFIMLCATSGVTFVFVYLRRKTSR